MANKARGEVEIVLGDQSYTLTFGLGVCAEIEDICGVENFEEALVFGEKLSGRRIRDLLTAIVKGNGFEITDEARRAICQTTLEEFMQIVGALMERANMKAVDPGKPAEGERPLAAKSAGKRG